MTKNRYLTGVITKVLLHLIFTCRVKGCVFVKVKIFRVFLLKVVKFVPLVLFFCTFRHR